MTSIHTNRSSKHDLELGAHKSAERPIIHQHHEVSPPSFKPSAIAYYFKTRFTELIPTKEYMRTNRDLLNPLPALAEISGHQWNYIMVAFLAWSADALDFFSVVMNVDSLATDLNCEVTDITWGTTIVLMLRSVGSVAFGLWADKVGGSRIPLVVNLLMMVCIQIGFSFIQTYQQFLGVRAAFGIIMGGIYGNAVATALDDCPPRARGFISGFMQQGYAFGYLIAVIFTRAIADTQSHKWRAMYWVEAGITFLIAVSRAVLPETNASKEQMLEKKLQENSGVKQQSFFIRLSLCMKSYWLMFIYLVLLMSGFNFSSHGSQDLYPTFLRLRTKANGEPVSEDSVTVINCVANLGALFGGLTIGHFSNFVGRRLTIIYCCIGGGALVAPWVLAKGSSIAAAAFFLQAFTQGAFGVIPAHLSELADPQFKSFIVGMSYQLGNLASSASSTIESTIGARFPIGKPLEHKYDYGKVMAIFMGCVYAYLLLITFIGPENRHIVEDIAEQDQIDQFFHDGKSDENVNADEIENVETKMDNNVLEAKA